jgi:hypothetical protein
MKSKEGAIYTLHLIGIDSKIAGRSYEEFVNKKARAALLNLLHQNDLQEQVAELLGRDPWLSDVPILINQLKTSTSDCWSIVNLLSRYRLKEFPIKQSIPASIYEKTIPISYNSDFNNYLRKIFSDIKLHARGQVEVEESLFNEKLGGNMWYNISEVNGKTEAGKLRIGTFLTRATEVDYSYIGNKFQYYVEGSKVFICSAATSKVRIVEWWDLTSSDEKIKFSVDRPVRRIFIVTTPSGR